MGAHVSIIIMIWIFLGIVPLTIRSITQSKLRERNLQLHLRAE